MARGTSRLRQRTNAASTAQFKRLPRCHRDTAPGTRTHTNTTTCCGRTNPRRRSWRPCRRVDPLSFRQNTTRRRVPLPPLLHIAYTLKIRRRQQASSPFASEWTLPGVGGATGRVRERERATGAPNQNRRRSTWPFRFRLFSGGSHVAIVVCHRAEGTALPDQAGIPRHVSIGELDPSERRCTYGCARFYLGNGSRFLHLSELLFQKNHYLIN